MEQLPVHISFQLAILGFGASQIVDFIRLWFLKLDDYPRLKATWKYYPPLLGTILINFFPSIVPTNDLLILWAHGAGSPLVAIALYPYIEKAFSPKALSVIAPKEPAQLPKSAPTPKEGTK